MTKPTDDLEAVRVVVEALQGFDAGDQARIIRWAREKLGLVASPAPQIRASSEPTPSSATPTVKHLAIVERPVVEAPKVEQPVVERPVLSQPAVEQQAVVEPLEVEQVEPAQVKPAEEQPEAVNLLMPAPEEKSRAFLVIGIIVMAIAVGFLILMIVSHGK